MENYKEPLMDIIVFSSSDIFVVAEGSNQQTTPDSGKVVPFT